MKTTRRDFLIQVCKGVTVSLGPGLIMGQEAWAFYNQLMHNKRVVRVTISANTLNFNLRNHLTSAGWNGSANLHNVLVTIKSGVYVYSDDVAQYAFDSGSLPAGTVVTLRNNGYILGRGGDGGGSNRGTENGQNGGPAMNINCNFIIDNQSGYIGGGGGGGGGASTNSAYIIGGGGGAGGGEGGEIDNSGNVVAGGAGGGPGSSGGNGGVGTNGACSGGGGGRVAPGSTTTGPDYDGVSIGRAGVGGSAGGSGSIRTWNTNGGLSGSGTSGGDGGAAGAAGTNGVQGSLTGSYRVGAGGGGGGWGQAGGSGSHSSSSFPSVNGTGGSGGKAINLNGKTVTWVGGAASSGRAYGTVS